MNDAGDILRETAARLNETLGDLALPYAERLLEKVLHCSRTQLYLQRRIRINERCRMEIDRIVERCRNDEPLDYILGTTFFFNREFEVAPTVLLPRPDTETLVERVLAGERSDELYLADIGTGSGIIACILTEERPGWRAVGVDLSAQALWVARRNLRSRRVALVCADVLCALAAEPAFDVIVSNPPYIPSADVDRLDCSVRVFEPRSALDGGPDGLAFYRRLAAEAPVHLLPGGRVYCEIGYDQAAAVESIFSTGPWTGFRCTGDLNGHPRVISVTAKKADHL